jgi:hypothetical protein
MIGPYAHQSLRDWETFVRNHPPMDISWEMHCADSHEKRLRAVEKAIDFAVLDMIKCRQVHQRKSEDELTFFIIASLRGMGFQVSHDTQVGGHCDIVVEGADNFLWIAEAKKHRRAYQWLLDGLKQLITRYATGQDGQNAGELLIYYFFTDSSGFVTRWERYFGKTYPAKSIARCNFDTEVIRSIHKHEGTGKDFRVRHKTIPLYFKPKK